MTRLASWADYGTHDESAYPELWQGCIAALPPCLGPTGLRLHDLSRFRNWGTLTNMVPADDWVVSGGRYALDFDGVNDYVACPSVVLPQDSSHTACCWVRMPNVTDVERRAFCETAGSSPTFTVSLAWGNDGFLGRNNKFQAFTEGTGVGEAPFATSTTSPVANVWYFVASRVDSVNDTIAIFVNGILEASSAFTAGMIVKAGSGLNVGTYRLADSRFMEGQMDDIRLYNRALTDAELRLLSIRRGIAYERRTRHQVFFDAAFFNPAWLAQGRNIIGGGVC